MKVLCKLNPNTSNYFSLCFSSRKLKTDCDKAIVQASEKLENPEVVMAYCRELISACVFFL